MARQILHSFAKLEKFPNAPMLEVETRVAELAGQRVAGVSVFPRSHEGGQAIERFRIERQGLADFACGRAAAIADDVRGHGRTQFSIAFVDILNGALPLVAAREVEVNVRPLAALFGQKSFEEKIHSHGIHRGDAERVANGAIGRGAAPLHQNIFFAAKADNVPDDQKVAGEVEFFDQGELAVNLTPRAFVARAVAENHSFVRALAKEFHLRPAAGNRIGGKLIAEVVQAKLQATGKNFRGGNGLGKIGEKRRHFRVRLEMALGIAAQQAAGVREHTVMANAGEDIQQLALLGQRVRDAISSQQRQLQLSRDGHRSLVARFLFAAEMALQFDVNIFPAERAAKLLHAFDGGVEPALRQSVRERTFVAPRQADQAATHRGDFLVLDASLPFARAKLHPRDQTAQILIALARFDQQGIAPARRGRDFRADMRANGKFFRRQMKTGRAVHAVPIEQRHGGHIVFRAHAGQFFGRGSAFEKTECGSRVQLDVHQS